MRTVCCSLGEMSVCVGCACAPLQHGQDIIAGALVGAVTGAVAGAGSGAALGGAGTTGLALT